MDSEVSLVFELDYYGVYFYFRNGEVVEEEVGRLL